MQGSRAGSDAGDPRARAAPRTRAPRAARGPGRPAAALVRRGLRLATRRGEWARDDVLATNVGAGVRRHAAARLARCELRAAAPSRARTAYALAYRAVADLAALDPRARALALLSTTGATRGRWIARCGEAYGLTQSGFEAHWRARTMRRYGALAVLANLSVLFALSLAARAPALWFARRRDRRGWRRCARRSGGRAGRAGAARSTHCWRARARARSLPPRTRSAATRSANADVAPSLDTFAAVILHLPICSYHGIGTRI